MLLLKRSDSSYQRFWFESMDSIDLNDYIQVNSTCNCSNRPDQQCAGWAFLLSALLSYSTA